MRGLVTLALMALLGGCNRSSPQCGIPAYKPATMGDPSTAVLAATDIWVSHWARTYARSHETAGDVADAAIAECTDEFYRLSYASGHESSPVVARQTPAEIQQSYRKDAIRAVFHYRQEGCR